MTIKTLSITLDYDVKDAAHAKRIQEGIEELLCSTPSFVDEEDEVTDEWTQWQDMNAEFVGE